MSKTTQKSENERRRALMIDGDPLLDLLLDIQRIVHQPTARKEPALHHFQRDFDAIRALCEKGVGKYGPRNS